MRRVNFRYETRMHFHKFKMRYRDVIYVSQQRPKAERFADLNKRLKKYKRSVRYGSEYSNSRNVYTFTDQIRN